MTNAILGRKIGMTRLYNESGQDLPVTVLQVGPCYVSQIKTVETDGYHAVQLAYREVKGRNSTVPLIARDAKAGLTPKRHHRECLIPEEQAGDYQLGQEITVESFKDVKFVDVIGTSKGKGFSGVIKRWGFKGQLASHGVERKHRSGGSVGGRSSNLGTGKPKRGIRMAGRHGNARVTSRSLEVVGHDKDKNLLLVKGTVPGANKSFIVVRQAVRLHKGKARILREAGKQTDS